MPITKNKLTTGLREAPEIPGTTESWARIGGYRMRFLRAGSGPPLLLIPGLLAYSFSWRFNIAELAKLRAVYAPDLLGTGYSDHPSEIDCSITGNARRLLAFLDTLGIGHCDVLGTSHGGGVAVLMATLAPERVGKLILSAPVNPWSSHGRLLTRVLATGIGRMFFRLLVPAFAATSYLWLDRMYGDPRRIRPGTMEGYRDAMTAPGGWEYGLGIVRCWQADLRQLERDYESLRDREALLIWGDKDRAVLPSSANEIVKRMPKANLAMLKGVGHLPYEEVPEEFNAVVSRFLQAAS